jgi:hypothetical protein
MNRIIVASALMLGFFLLVAGSERRVRELPRIARYGHGDGAIDRYHNWYYRNGDKQMILDRTPERAGLAELQRRIEELIPPPR